MDYILLIFLGITRKLVLLKLSKTPDKVYVSIEKLYKSLLDAKTAIYHQWLLEKTRTINEINRWKAKKLKLYLFYIEPSIRSNLFYYFIIFLLLFVEFFVQQVNVRITIYNYIDINKYITSSCLI